MVSEIPCGYIEILRSLDKYVGFPGHGLFNTDIFGEGIVRIYVPSSGDVPVYELYKYVGVYNKLQYLIASLIALDDRDPIKILDLGIGSCNSIEYILDVVEKPRKIIYTGVDISLENIGFCREKLENMIIPLAREKNILINYSFIREDLVSDHLTDKIGEKYHHILLISVLEFLGNWRKALRNSFELLSDEDSRIYVAIPYKIPSFIRKAWTVYTGLKTFISMKLKKKTSLPTSFPTSYVLRKIREGAKITDRFRHEIPIEELLDEVKSYGEIVFQKSIIPYMDIFVIQKK